MRLTISGNSGSGKTTVAKVLAEKLKLKHYYMGEIMRNLAKERGMTIDDFKKVRETDSSADKLVDDFLVKIGKTEDDFIAEGRTAAYFIPNSIKIFLDVDLKVGAKRIFDDLTQKGAFGVRNEKIGGSVEEQIKHLRERNEFDRATYKKIYGFDFLDKNMYDVWINTSKMTPEEVIEKILLEVKFKND